MTESRNEHTKFIEKGTVLSRPGTICKSAYKVIKGCLKSYVIDAAGKEHILQFAPEGWFISDLDSFTHKTPSTLFIEAIENSEVRRLHDLNSDPENPRDLDLKTFNEKLLNSVIAKDKRLISLLSATSEQRYVDFTQTYPSLVERLPQKLIAAYIGVTPEYLSDIRRKRLSK